MIEEVKKKNDNGEVKEQQNGKLPSSQNYSKLLKIN